MTEKKIKVTLKKSLIGVPEKHKKVVKALGLKRTNHTLEKNSTPEIIGMIQKVEHLLSVSE